ncbi:MAG: hypothetical protein RLZZ543_1759, partial [Bacteroidota bacterium]
GESLSVEKDLQSEDPSIYSGTLVVSGMATARVTAVGNATRLGTIGKGIEAIEEEKTPLELQIANFVKQMAIAGAVVFFIVWLINYLNTHSLLDSLLQSLTLAMSILPEEIPVAFTTFMALGAWRLMQMGIVVKQMKTVETLGSATVICTDKTGTITENKMSLARVYSWEEKRIVKLDNPLTEPEKEVVKWAMFASEIAPFDPMEIALHLEYEKLFHNDIRKEWQMVHEYPLSGKPPMMTHCFENSQKERITASKGASEAIMAVSHLSDADKLLVHAAIKDLSSEGYRVLAVAKADLNGKEFPKEQQEIQFQFIGLVAFYDPPKANIEEVLKHFYAAGISVKIITGDNALTTKAIAKQIGFKEYDKSISGEALMKLNDEELAECVMHTHLFTRMFPEAKLKIINALKAQQQIVAMTGDGVNDGPALKAAHIGIAMGKKGSEIAKQAASLILLEDDLSKMVDAIAIGRKIYSNLKKAIQYIISIHIPIILTVFIPLALGWMYPSIFSPIHIIFLEIIMGPTCSIIYENEPMEKNTMLVKPKAISATFFNWRELSLSIIQGLVITAGTLFMYQWSVMHGYSEALTRTLIFCTLITSNIFLTLINRSFYYSVITTLSYHNRMVPIIILITASLTAMLLFIPALTRFFSFEQPLLPSLMLSIGIGFTSVMWFEIVKGMKRLQSPKP